MENTDKQAVTDSRTVASEANTIGEYVVVDKFGEGQTVMHYVREDHAREAAANINRLTGHETAVYIGDRRLVTFSGRVEQD